MYFTHTVEFYSDVKRNGVLTPITARVNLESITLTERKPGTKAIIGFP